MTISAAHAPAISLPRVAAHAHVLLAFRALYAALSDATGEARLAFALAAVDRFYSWLEGPARALGGWGAEPVPEDALPPLDVLLVAYAHMLQPHQFYEATLLDPKLAVLERFPLVEMVRKGLRTMRSGRLIYLLSSNVSSTTTHSRTKLRPLRLRTGRGRACRRSRCRQTVPAPRRVPRTYAAPFAPPRSTPLS
jgi:hypothetical protein